MVAGNNPLRGTNDPMLGDRFPPVSDAYDSTLQSLVLNIAESIGMGDIVQPGGVYCMAAGPSYESKAECRFLRSIGGDTVGMSTIPEIIAARHCGMKVLCLSFVTNKVVTGLETHEVVPASHAEVIDSVEKGGKNILQLVTQFVSKARLGEFLHSTKPAPVFDYKAHAKAAAEAKNEPAASSSAPSCSSSSSSSGCGSAGCTAHDMALHALFTVGLVAVGVYAGYMISTRK